MNINLIHNLPFFSIFLAMLGGILTALISDKRKALKLNQFIVLVVFTMSLILLINLYQNQETFTFMMGHFPAPWGNELRAGPLEALMTTFFSFIMFITISAGKKEIFEDIVEDKIKYFFIMINLIFGSILALIYTNDVFTSYVFIEINTIASCAVIMAKSHGRSIAASIHYLIMASLGSGLFLIGLTMLYDITGHLLMPNIQESLIALAQSGEYRMPLIVVTGLIFIGLSIKSALFPFHTMLPNAYDSSTGSSAGILSGLVLKSYIMLIIKFIYQVYSLEVFTSLGMNKIYFVFGILGMIFGSLLALKEVRIKKMLAYSSVAQIGYIFMGIGFGTYYGIAAACFHMLAHACTKTALFASVGQLQEVNHKKNWIKDLRGTARLHPVAGLTYTVAALSMVGFPFLAGFASKYFFAIATGYNQTRLTIVIIALAISMILNALYFIPTVISIWSMPHDSSLLVKPVVPLSQKLYLLAFVAVNFALGIFFNEFMKVILLGINLLG